MTNQKGETIFNNTVIPAPRLDMMGFPSYSAIYPGHGIPDSKFAAYPRHTWVYGNHTYNQTYFETKGSCQPTQVYSISKLLYSVINSTRTINGASHSYNSSSWSHYCSY